MRAKANTSLLARTAEEIKQYRQIKRFLPAVLAMIAIVVALSYIIAVMYTRFGSFTVSVNKFDALNYGLSLCEHKDQNKLTSRLECRASEMITNIDGRDLDKITFGTVDGVDSGDNYLCYTFYCINTGEEQVDFEYSMNIANTTMNIDQAVRVRLITNINGQNGTSEDFAHASKYTDANNNAIAEEGTTMFYDKSTVMRDTVSNFQAGDYMKLTVVIWLEGTDDECVDDIIGGEFKVDMKFNVIAHGGVAV